MIKVTTLALSVITMLFGCQQDSSDKQQYRVVVSKITKGGLSEWYEVQEQYISQPCNETSHFASAYLCTKPETKDTVLIISPCNHNRFKKHTGVALYVYNNVRLGDTVIINIPKRYEKFLQQETTIAFGTPQIPVD
jgi:hypothetical protein